MRVPTLKTMLFGLVAVLAAHTAAAAELSQKTTEKIKQLVAKQIEDVDLANLSISSSPVDGMYQVNIPPNVVYVTKDLKYLIYADILEAATSRNLTEQARGKSRQVMLEKLGEKSMIVYPPKTPRRYSLTVLTDLDCGYCQKLHHDMAKYNDLGIEVRYIAFPRAGVLSPSYQKAVNVWCARDRKKAYDQVSAGKDIEESHCENPVADQFNFGRSIGVQGTPSMILEDGTLMQGYYPPEKLLEKLQLHFTTAKL